MKEMKTALINLAAFTLLYLAAAVLSHAGQTVLPSFLLLLAAALLYLREYRRTGQLLNLTGLYALGLIGGEGVACLKLSRLSTVWTGETWLSFYLAYALFYAAAFLMQRRQEGRAKERDAAPKTLAPEKERSVSAA